MLNHWLLIGFLSVSTYLSRMIGVEIMAKRKMSSTVRHDWIVHTLFFKQLHWRR